MRGGSQRVRIEIWHRVQTGVDPLYNVPIEQDVLWKETWSELTWRRGRQHYEAGQVFSLTSAMFCSRFFSVQGINTTHWIVLNGQAYTVFDVQPDFTKKDHVVIEARVRGINIAQGAFGPGLFALAIGLPETPPSGQVGIAYAGFAIDAIGGTEPYVFSITAGSLPTGLAINPATGAVSGTPIGAGAFPLVITVTDAVAQTASVPQTTITISD